VKSAETSRAARARQHRVIAQLERALAHVHPSERPRDSLRARAESVLATLEDVDCAILIANDWGRYVHVNDRAARLTGYSAAELGRRSVWDLTPDVRLATGRRMWRAFLEIGRQQGPYVIQRKNGRSISVEYVAIAHVLPGLHVSALLRAPAHPQRAPGATRTRRAQAHNR
jgi:PAS domain S-box-containing protein